MSRPPLPAPARGEHFARWTVVGPVFVDHRHIRRVPCRCECGKESDVRLTYLRHGRSRQCRSCASSLGWEGRRNEPPEPPRGIISNPDDIEYALRHGRSLGDLV